jgi:hypothetical protein
VKKRRRILLLGLVLLLLLAVVAVVGVSGDWAGPPPLTVLRRTLARAFPALGE